MTILVPKPNSEAATSLSVLKKGQGGTGSQVPFVAPASLAASNCRRAWAKPLREWFLEPTRSGAQCCGLLPSLRVNSGTT